MSRAILYTSVRIFPLFVLIFLIYSCRQHYSSCLVSLLDTIVLITICCDHFLLTYLYALWSPLCIPPRPSNSLIHSVYAPVKERHTDIIRLYPRAICVKPIQNSSPGLFRRLRPCMARGFPPKLGDSHC